MALFKKSDEAQGADNAEKSTKELYSQAAVKAVKGGHAKISGARLLAAGKVLVRPLVTEKGTDLNSLNKYIFEVAAKTNKIEVAKAIEAIYGVKPSQVNIIKMEGKRKAGRNKGKRKDWKKAIVSLPTGKTINVYEGV